MTEIVNAPRAAWYATARAATFGSRCLKISEKNRSSAAFTQAFTVVRSNPIRDARENSFAAREFRSIGDLNDQARAWCLEIAKKRHVPDAPDTTCEVALHAEVAAILDRRQRCYVPSMIRARAWFIGCAVAATIALVLVAVFVGAVVGLGWATWATWFDRGTVTCSAWCDTELGFNCDGWPTLYVGGREIEIEDTVEPRHDVSAPVKPGDRVRCVAAGKSNKQMKCAVRVGSQTLATGSGTGSAVCTAVAPH